MVLPMKLRQFKKMFTKKVSFQLDFSPEEDKLETCYIDFARYLSRKVEEMCSQSELALFSFE